MPDYDLIWRAAKNGDRAYFSQQIRNGLSFEQAVLEQIATERVVQENPEEVAGAYRSMTPEDFADHFTQRASRQVQQEKGGYHINWFNYDKLARMLREVGFSTIYRSEPQGSKFGDLRGEGGWLTVGDVFEIKRMLGIDTTHPDRSLYVEAVK